MIFKGYIFDFNFMILVFSKGNSIAILMNIYLFVKIYTL